jgi:hypothetical protein
MHAERGYRHAIRHGGLLLALTLFVLSVGSAQATRSPLPGVMTPTGNVRCFYVPAAPAHLLCSIREAAYSQREQDSCMARSGLDWHGWTVFATHPTTTVCSSGILYNSNRNFPLYRRLAYGATWHFAAFTCISRIAGLTCTTSTGHGMFLSRQSWRGW